MKNLAAVTAEDSHGILSLVLLFLSQRGSLLCSLGFSPCTLLPAAWPAHCLPCSSWRYMLDAQGSVLCSFSSPSIHCPRATSSHAVTLNHILGLPSHPNTGTHHLLTDISTCPQQHSGFYPPLSAPALILRSQRMPMVLVPRLLNQNPKVTLDSSLSCNPLLSPVDSTSKVLWYLSTSPLSSPTLLTMWFADQQYQHHLGIG